MSDSPCPFCGAYSRRSCEMEEEVGHCPWDEAEPDPDILREQRDELRNLRREEESHARRVMDMWKS